MRDTDRERTDRRLAALLTGILALTAFLWILILTSCDDGGPTGTGMPQRFSDRLAALYQPGFS